MGNVVEDLVGGAWVPGGPSVYTARAAVAMGIECTLVAGVPADYPDDALAGVDVRAIPVATACRYENTYHGEKRVQMLRHPGETLAPALVAGHVGPGESFDAVIAAPAFQELHSFPPVRAEVEAVWLQGALRAERCGRVTPVDDPVAATRDFAGPGRLLFCSDEDLGDTSAALLAGELTAAGSTVVITAGNRGATMYGASGARHFASIRSDAVVDPTGAGDAFATAFVARFVESRDLDVAMTFALAAGSLAVERTGVFGMPTRAEIESRAKVASSP